MVRKVVGLQCNTPALLSDPEYGRVGLSIRGEGEGEEGVAGARLAFVVLVQCKVVFSGNAVEWDDEMCPPSGTIAAPAPASSTRVLNAAGGSSNPAGGSSSICR